MTSTASPAATALKSALDGAQLRRPAAVCVHHAAQRLQRRADRFPAGQTNSVLVITAGPHTDQSLDSTGLQDFVRQSADPARPVAVNVIDVGADPDRPTWEAVARLSGGTYQNLATSASPDLATAVDTFLS